MRILRIVYDWPPPWQGLAPHPYELTAAQVERGHTFDLFCGRWPKAGPIEELPNVKITSFIREPFPGAIFFTSSLMMFFKYLFSYRTDDDNEVNLIHSHGHFGIWIYLYRRILQTVYPRAEELQIPLIVHFHNTVEGRWRAAEERDTVLKFTSKYLAWPLARFSDKLAVKVASACIFVSDKNKDEAVKYYKADPKKCFVVETGVNTELFTPIAGEEWEKSRTEAGLDTYDKVVVNHGVMSERKNVHLLVEALQYLPADYKLLLVGSGDLEYLGKINFSIEKYNLHDRVVRVGYTPYPTTPVAFQVADVFVLPSDWEGFPKVVMQSLACGVPVLASGFKAREDIKGLYYLENQEPETIARQIRQVVEYPQEVDRYLIAQKYSWKVKAEEVEGVYNQVINLQNTTENA
jgi:glycosyltransferase involved in cell wall biosynthesis